MMKRGNLVEEERWVDIYLSGDRAGYRIGKRFCA
jgi:hypothetical protein